MVEWGVTEEGIVACGPAGRVTVGVDDWHPRAPAVPLVPPVDVSVAGEVGELRLPGPVRNGDGALAPPATTEGEGEPVRVVSEPGVVLAFEGVGTVRGHASAPRVGFEGSRVVAIGFRGEHEAPETVTVPGTPAGIATYLTHASASLRTTTPDRSHPTMRAHPPLLTLGETDVPDSVADATPDTGLTLHVPADLEHVFVAAPLAYYLGATVAVGSTEPALVGDGRIRTFQPLPEFHHEVAALVRRVFGLDAAVRATAGATDPPLPESVRDAPPADRLRRYRQVPDEEVPAPTWHLSTSVDPTPARARCLPYLLDRLSLIYLAESTPLDGRALLQRALDDFFRARPAAPSVDTLAPEVRTGAAQAWLADGTPIDAFTTDVTAHQHSREGADTGGPLAVDLVLNDPEMDDERAVADCYRRGVVGDAIEVTVHERLRSGALARVFEAEGDLVHYVGHCETGGLVCPDGTLSATSLDRVRSRTVFLNACGSVYEGRTLVRAGAAAAAVTLKSVLNAQAATVGTAFARLLGAGLAFQRAMRHARSGVMMGTDYAVVGDGTVAVAPVYGHPGILQVETTAAGYRTEYRVVSPRVAGRRYRDPFDGARRLYGTVATATLDRAALCDLCRELEVPVVLDGDVLASDDVLAELE